MNVTLKKISEVLDLSISTVSRALKNHPDISSSTRQKVIELATVLDYEPNANAINLRKQNNNVFGLMVPSVSNSFYDSFMSAVEEGCRISGYSLLIMQSADDPEIEKNILKIYRQNRVSGCFICLSPSGANLSSFRKLDDLSIPIVFFDKLPEEQINNQVSTDDEAAARLAAQALIGKGKKNILALFGDESLSISRIRRQAFMDVINEHDDIKLSIEVAKSTDSAREITHRCLQSKNKPDGIFCMSDEILVGSMKALQQLGFSHPGQVGIISMSDGYFPKLYYPEITYVETSGYKLGELAFDVMTKCIADHHSAIRLTVDPKLVDGGSL